jgi:L-seryl-tRNA(Ser) seleniumtransferase
MKKTPVSEEEEKRERLRGLPAVERLAAELPDVPRALAIAAAREEIDRARAGILAGDVRDPDAGALREAVRKRATRLQHQSLRRVINATGVILHTNLGRAPLAPEAAEAAAEVAGGYSNLELNLDEGRRGSRHDHVEPLIRQLTGAEASIAVNNNAAGVLLALSALASGGEVVLSRGQLVEIGGSFRIPEVMEASGTRLVEVGTTNRTRLADYADAIGPATAALMVVHQSNFRTVGFVHETELRDLAGLASEHGLPLIDDLGSGALGEVDGEPSIADRLRAGADVVCFSADKLLGGPQAGILAGRSQLIDRCRRHPLARALRLDKLQLAALEASLRIYRDRGPEAIPALRMLTADDQILGARAAALAGRAGPSAFVGRGEARPGGGSLPLTTLEGPVCVVDPDPLGADELTARLRAAAPPVIARIAGGRVILDPRTMSDAEAELAGDAVRAALA